MSVQVSLCGRVHFQNLRPLGIAELCSLNNDLRVAGFGLVTNFATDMLTLSIAISPDKEDFGISRLHFDILGKWQLVLVYGNEGGSLKQLTWRTGLPAFVFGIKVQAAEMAQDTGHGDRTVTPLSEVKIKLVIFDILTAANRVL